MLADLLIVGAGSAGMTAAICAAQRGKQVIVVEKAAEPGGTLHYTAGHLSAAGTRLQQEKGILDTPEEHYADIARISRDTMNSVITKKAVVLAPKTLNWLEELGYPFHEKAPLIIYGHEPYGKPRTYLGIDDIRPLINAPGKTVLKILKPLWDQYVAAGKITVYYNTRMVGMEVESNKVEGIRIDRRPETGDRFVATDQWPMTNDYAVLTASNYILTTGGYASNPELFKEVTEGVTRLISTANPNSTGDGIIAARACGARISSAQKHSSTLGGIELEPGSGRVDFWGAWARVSNGVDRKQREIYINENGVRFMNEYDLHADEREQLVLQQPNRRFWLIFDHIALYDGTCVVPQWTPEQLIEESKKEKAVWQAQTIEVLAQKINVPVDVLQQTINNYNQYCKTKTDTEYARTYLEHPVTTAPYYAILVYAYSLISFGGIDVNENLQVLKEDGTCFENLYAAGEILGAAATSGHAFCGGMLLTPALSFGKYLGESL
jgi:fumarate reductase flavoprotein subunit